MECHRRLVGGRARFREFPKTFVSLTRRAEALTMAKQERPDLQAAGYGRLGTADARARRSRAASALIEKEPLVRRLFQ